MNSILINILKTASDPRLFESSSARVCSPPNAVERAAKQPLLFGFIPRNDQRNNRYYSASYIFLWFSKNIIEVLILLILVQSLGIQTINILGITYFFHYITITVPVATLSRVACISLSWLVKRSKPLSFLVYSLVYISMSLTFTCAMALLCTLFGVFILKYLHGEIASLLSTTYYISLWTNATIVTIATCMHHILIAEGRSFILLAAMLVQNFVRICAFMAILFYSTMSMSRETNYWTTLITKTNAFPSSEFFYNGVLYTVDNSSITPTFDLYRFISPFTPCYLPEDSIRYLQVKPVKAHFYSYQLSNILANLAFIFVSFCLILCRTREMGWANHARDPIAVSVPPYSYAFTHFPHLSISSKELVSILLHFIRPWIPLYIDAVSNLLPLFVFNLLGVWEIIATERTTLAIMQHTLFYILSDMFNAPNVSIMNLFTPMIVEAYVTRMYKKEILITRKAIFLCIFISVVLYPLNVHINQLIYKFQPSYTINLTVLEKIWLEELYGDPKALLIQPVATVIMGTRMLLLTHLAMERKIIYMYLLSCERLLFSMLFAFSRDTLSSGTLVKELFICDVLISVTSMIGLIMSAARYAVLKS